AHDQTDRLAKSNERSCIPRGHKEMKTACTIIASALLCLTSAFARIGETEKEIEARYGKWIPPITASSGIPMKMYRAHGMLVGVSFIDGRAEAEFYQKGDHGAFSEHEIQLLLDANGNGTKWEKANRVDLSHDNWTRPGALASYSKFSPALMVLSARYNEVAKESREREEKEKLKGF
nr:hypothetical protein [Verrucomicrobiota bacterium]